jgi:hypothetical protein
VQYQDGAAAVAVSVTAQWKPCPYATSIPGLLPFTDIQQSSVEAGKLRWPEVRRYAQPLDDGSVLADYYLFYKTEVRTASGTTAVLWAELQQQETKMARSRQGRTQRTQSGKGPAADALRAACDEKVDAMRSAIKRAQKVLDRRTGPRKMDRKGEQIAKQAAKAKTRHEEKLRLARTNQAASADARRGIVPANGDLVLEGGAGRETLSLAEALA